VEPVYKSKEHYQSCWKSTLHNSARCRSFTMHPTLRRPAELSGYGCAGKDGAIKHVMSGVNPQGCQVFSFNIRSCRIATRFLWRTTRDLPESGDRHLQPILLRGGVDRPRTSRDSPQRSHPDDNKAIWHDRYRSIADLERHLHVNGTRIVKIYLHLSKEEQRSVSWRVSTSRKRTGSSVSRTSRSGNSGSTI